MSITMNQQVKSCGPCSACCIYLRIDYEGLRKMPDVPCQHIKEGGGCNIYSQRPKGCKDWNCGWLKLPNLEDKWRPDMSGFLIRLDDKRLIFQATSNIRHSRFWSHEFLTIAFELMSQGYDLGLSIPTKKGFTNYLSHLTPVLAKPAQQGNYYEAEKAMRTVIFHAKHSQTDKEVPME